MQVVQAVQDLHHHRPGLGLRNVLHLLQVGVEIAVGTVLQTKDYVTLGLEGVQQIDQVVVFDGEEDVLLVLQHLGLLDGGDGVLPDELEGTVLVVELALAEEDLGEPPTAQELADFEVTELEAVVADGFLEDGGDDGDLLDVGVSEDLEGAGALFIDELGEVVAEGHGLEAGSAVVIVFALLHKIEDMLLEVCVDGGEGV